MMSGAFNKKPIPDSPQESLSAHLELDDIGEPTLMPGVDDLSTVCERDGAGNSFRMFILDEAAIQARQRGHDVIQLTLGICDLPLRDEICDVILAATRDPVVSHRVCPAGLPELREALSRYYTDAYGVEVPSSRILVDAGTSSIFRTLIQILTRPGDEILLPLPYYPLYKISAILAHAKCRFYRICLDTLRIDMDSVMRGITDRTKVVVLNSPGNPLGNIVSSPELLDLIHALPPHIYLIVDEVYDNVRFYDDGPPLGSSLFCDQQQLSRLIVTNSVSKAYRMYTRRVGWCILPETLVRPMTIIQQHTRLTVDPAVQLGVVEALKYPEDISVVRITNRARWEHTLHQLADVDGVRLLPSSGGFYCVLDCRQFITEHRIPNCLQLAIDILDQVEVATVPGDDFGLPGMLRLSFTNGRYEEAIDRLRTYFGAHDEGVSHDAQ